MATTEYRFFAKNGTKPLIVNAESPEQAKQILNKFLMSQGIRRNADEFPMQAGSREDIAKQEASTMQERTKQAQKQVMDEEAEQEGFGTRLAKGALKVFAPNLAESYEQTGEGNALASITDAVMLPFNALGFGSGGTAKKTADVAKKSGIVGKGVDFAKRLLTNPDVGYGAVNTLADVAQQQRVYGDVDPFRTAVGAGLGVGAPVVTGAGTKLKETGKRIVENKVLPTKKMTSSPNPPNFDKALDEGLFRGASKFSAIDKLEKRFEPIYAQLKAIRSGDSQVDIDTARQKALGFLDGMDLLESERELARNKVNSLFDAEMEQFEKRIPARTHDEAVPNPMFYNARDNAEQIIEEAQNQGSFYVPPMKDFGFNQVDPWTVERVIEEPARSVFEMPISKALDKKTIAQGEAYSQATANERGGKPAFASMAVGLLDAITEASPQARELMQQLAPDYPMYKALEARKAVGGSNSPLPLKAVITGAQNPLAGVGVGVMDSPLGGQLLYDAGKGLRKAKLDDFASMLGYRPSMLTTNMDNNDE